MVVKPYRLVNRSDRARLAARVTRAFEQLKPDWFVDALECSAETLADGARGRQRDWKAYRLLPQNGASVGVAIRDVDIDVLIAGAVVRTPNASAGWLVTSLREQFRRALAVAVLQSEDSASDSRLIESPEFLSDDTVDVRCALQGGIECFLRFPIALAEEDAMPPVVRERSTLTRLAQALGRETVPLTVELGAAEITLGELRTLCVGDVLRLDRKVDQPLPVRVAGGELIGYGYLGAVGERKAVQLSATND